MALLADSQQAAEELRRFQDLLVSVNNDNAQNTKAEVVDRRLFPKPQGLQGLLPKGFQGGEALLLEGVHQGVPLPVRFLLGTDGEEAEGGGEVPPVVQKGVFPSGG